MSIKQENGKWIVDIQPNGRHGKRYKRGFKSKTEAVQFERWVIEQCRDKPEWQPVTADRRRLSELVERWFAVHGVNLRYSTGRLRILLNLCTAMENPIAHQFRAGDFLEYRQRRIGEGTTANTLNHELSYLKAVFNRLIKIDEWQGTNPLRSVEKLKFREQELSFLTLDEVRKLLLELEKGRNKDALLVAQVCLCTGARWGEVMQLTKSQVRADRVTFVKTKNNEQRTVPMDKSLCLKVQTRLSTAPFSPCDAALRHAINDAALRHAIKRCQLRLPRGQKIHVLRHTFASHFVMNNGNLLTLQKILGHKTLAITLRYAHLAPEYLNSALVLNPIALIQQSQ